MAKRKSRLKKMTKGYVGAGVGLGIGASVLGGMGQGSLAGQVITPGANMMGPLMSAGYGMEVVKTINEKSKKKESK